MYKHCVGAVDGFHIGLKAIPHEAKNYRESFLNRKNQLSVGYTIAAVDPITMRIAFFAGPFKGKTHDSKQLSLTDVYVKRDTFLLADSAYAEMDTVMRPFGGKKIIKREEE